MTRLYAIMLLSYLIISAMACHKTTETNPNTIIGNWRLVESVGGIAGSKVFPDGKIIYTFKADSTYLYAKNDTLKGQGTFSIRSQKSVFSSTPQPHLNLVGTGSAYSRTIAIKNDSLFLNDDFPDGFGFLYIRIK